MRGRPGGGCVERGSSLQGLLLSEARIWRGPPGRGLAMKKLHVHTEEVAHQSLLAFEVLLTSSVAHLPLEVQLP